METSKKLTKDQIEKFIKVRNSALHNSNLQFSIDAGTCGFKVMDLGKGTQIEDRYEWTIPEVGILREQYGSLSLIEKGNYIQCKPNYT
jgi:hypothetical protein